MADGSGLARSKTREPRFSASIVEIIVFNPINLCTPPTGARTEHRCVEVPCLKSPSLEARAAFVGAAEIDAPPLLASADAALLLPPPPPRPPPPPLQTPSSARDGAVGIFPLPLISLVDAAPHRSEEQLQTRPREE